ncbi:MAG: 16S rRNA (cytidine(1402)-2'-O)-methyltransferase [Saprospirales bacterium]|nr:MAG: 16S rRNA (cytidine(1402)-2'-O)-methyltransferase [Saprospirales bacterium]
MLYLIPTPIGNLEDITFRAVRLLGEVDYLLVEDSRVTGRLLNHYGIENKMVPFHAHNEHRQIHKVLEDLRNGCIIGLLTDAGSPGISDPGFLLVRACRSEEIEMSVLPGASAVITALTGSGIPCDKFFFEGFLPHKKGRKTRLHYLSRLHETFVLFESPHRIKKCLAELLECCGAQRKASICREMTKVHEEVIHGTLEDLNLQLEQRADLRGEIVLVVEGAEKNAQS